MKRVVGLTSLLWGIVLFTFVGTAAAEPVRVAIIDAPVDYGNPDITPYLDEEALQRIRMRPEGAVESAANLQSLLEFNAYAMNEAWSAIDRNLVNEQVRVLDLMTRSNAGEALSRDDKEFLQVIRWKLMLSRRYRAQLNTLGTILHGTHVAGLVIDSLDPEKVKLISYPHIRVNGPSTEDAPEGLRLRVPGLGFLKRTVIGLLQGLSATVSDPAQFEQQVRESSRSHYAEMTRVLHEGRVQVANMSVGFDKSMALESILQNAGFLGRRIFRNGLDRLATTIVTVQQQEMARFFAENPTTIFVVAAGNDGESVDDVADHNSAAVGAPNVVNVAATDNKGVLAKFSNVSNKEIEIAAPGVAIPSVLAGARTRGMQVAMSGTSMATPIVTNRLASILADNPGVSVEQAIHILFTQHSEVRADLLQVVREGRWLTPRSLTVGTSNCRDALLPLPNAA